MLERPGGDEYGVSLEYLRDVEYLAYLLKGISLQAHDSIINVYCHTLPMRYSCFYIASVPKEIWCQAMHEHTWEPAVGTQSDCPDASCTAV